MIFGEIALDHAKGAVLAHAMKLPEAVFAKGHVLTEADLGLLRDAGLANVTAARLEDGDLSEDEAAAMLAAAMVAAHLEFSEAATGRVNVHSAVDGLFVADSPAVDRFNRIDPAITLACLADRSPVARGTMLATFKIIPLAVPRRAVEVAAALLRQAAAFRVRPFIAHSVFLIATELPALKMTVMDKTASILKQRLQPSGSALLQEDRVPHRPEDVARAILRAVDRNTVRPKLIVIFGASAVIDEADVIPDAIRRAGGEVIRVGMPVDPGNLLVLGRIGDMSIVGAPGCARSPKESGFDWIINRILVGDMPTSEDIGGLGVGGLLMEIGTRPHPRSSVKTSSQDTAFAVLPLAGDR